MKNEFVGKSGVSYLSKSEVFREKGLQSNQVNHFANMALKRMKNEKLKFKNEFVGKSGVSYLSKSEVFREKGLQSNQVNHFANMALKRMKNEK
jgi:predicted HicB family RNase H-like nuclease